MKSRKPKAETKEEESRVLVMHAQKRRLKAAPTESGQDLAIWLRGAGLREAARVLDR